MSSCPPSPETPESKTNSRTILLREDGPREGFQMLERIIPLEEKLELVHALVRTGVKSIEVTSFVRPDRVPQMAHAEELVERLAPVPGVHFRALYLNEKGFERACRFPVLNPEAFIMVAASETFLRENNNLTLQEALDAIPEWLARFQRRGLLLERLIVSTAFGEPMEGKIPAERTLGICRQALTRIEYAGVTLPEITFADTTGWGNPASVKRLVGEAKRCWPKIEIGLHLHDTRGTGMANVYAGIEEGVSRFDCSVGGLGGCPFARGAAGNVPTEDVAFLCEELGFSTGVDLEIYIECAKLAERIAGHPLPGKLKSGGILATLSQRGRSTA